MTLYEPVTVAFVIITVLILTVSGALFHGLYTTAQRDCHHRNADLAAEGKHGPAAPCLAGKTP